MHVTSWRPIGNRRILILPRPKSEAPTPHLKTVRDRGTQLMDCLVRRLLGGGGGAGVGEPYEQHWHEAAWNTLHL
jgi:hypothetical protein